MAVPPARFVRAMVVWCAPVSIRHFVALGLLTGETGCCLIPPQDDDGR